jgi:hypothetical protein
MDGGAAALLGGGFVRWGQGLDDRTDVHYAPCTMTDLISPHPVEREDPDGNRIQHPDRAIVVVPGCCEAAKSGTISLAYRGSRFDELQGEKPPVWFLRGPTEPAPGQEWGTPLPAPKVCPYCATPLPAIRRRQEPFEGPVALWGPNYCKTCKERTDNCLCWWPVAAWEPDE